MNKLVVCTANKLPNDKKVYVTQELLIYVELFHTVDSIWLQKEIEKLVGYMGGDFTDPLTTRTTHLVVSSAFSKRHLLLF